MNIPDYLEFHNCHPELSTANNGLHLPRYPNEVRSKMSAGKWTSGTSVLAEIRFVTESSSFVITLTNPGESAEVLVFTGSFCVMSLAIGRGETRSFMVNRPNFNSIPTEALRSGGWNESVWRIQFGRESIIFHSVDTRESHPIRKPHSDEKPSLRWLAYGSSITHADRNGYPALASALLGVDVLNKGLSGSCHIETSTVDYLADQDFHFATLELGINMRGQFDEAEFEKRTRYLLKTLRIKKPTAPLILITHFINREHVSEANLQDFKRQKNFDKILRTIFEESNDPNLYLVEGKDILRQFHLLSADLIHPTHQGLAQMAHNLAQFLEPILRNLRN